ncbi:MAG: hypothetical protein MZV70_55545 [Desulfobacterales bacterium]|nr:hypothetical protein [Desulfobacterales bacterium]
MTRVPHHLTFPLPISRIERNLPWRKRPSPLHRRHRRPRPTCARETALLIALGALALGLLRRGVLRGLQVGADRERRHGRRDAPGGDPAGPAGPDRRPRGRDAPEPVERGGLDRAGQRSTSTREQVKKSIEAYRKALELQAEQRRRRRRTWA